MNSLCITCKNHKRIKTKTSTFIMCLVKKPKYPPQPVIQCEVYVKST